MEISLQLSSTSAGLFGFGIATTRVLHLIFGIERCCRHEEKKLLSHSRKVVPQFCFVFFLMNSEEISV